MNEAQIFSRQDEPFNLPSQEDLAGESAVKQDNFPASLGMDSLDLDRLDSADNGNLLPDMPDPIVAERAPSAFVGGNAEGGYPYPEGQEPTSPKADEVSAIDTAAFMVNPLEEITVTENIGSSDEPVSEVRELTPNQVQANESASASTKVSKESEIIVAEQGVQKMEQQAANEPDPLVGGALKRIAAVVSDELRKALPKLGAVQKVREFAAGVRLEMDKTDEVSKRNAEAVKQAVEVAQKAFANIGDIRKAHKNDTEAIKYATTREELPAALGRKAEAAPPSSAAERVAVTNVDAAKSPESTLIKPDVGVEAQENTADVELANVTSDSLLKASEKMLEKGPDGSVIDIVDRFKALTKLDSSITNDVLHLELAEAVGHELAKSVELIINNPDLTQRIQNVKDAKLAPKAQGLALTQILASLRTEEGRAAQTVEASTEAAEDDEDNVERNGAQESGPFFERINVSMEGTSVSDIVPARQWRMYQEEYGRLNQIKGQDIGIPSTRREVQGGAFNYDGTDETMASPASLEVARDELFRRMEVTGKLRDALVSSEPEKLKAFKASVESDRFAEYIGADVQVNLNDFAEYEPGTNVVISSEADAKGKSRMKISFEKPIPPKEGESVPKPQLESRISVSKA